MTHRSLCGFLLVLLDKWIDRIPPLKLFESFAFFVSVWKCICRFSIPNPPAPARAQQHQLLSLLLLGCWRMLLYAIPSYILYKKFKAESVTDDMCHRLSKKLKRSLFRENTTSCTSTITKIPSSLPPTQQQALTTCLSPTNSLTNTAQIIEVHATESQRIPLARSGSHLMLMGSFGGK